MPFDTLDHDTSDQDAPDRAGWNAFAPRRLGRLVALAVVILVAAAAALAGSWALRGFSIEDVTPADGSRDVPWNGDLVVTFSRPLDETSAKEGVQLSPADETRVIVEDRRVRLTPPFGLRADTAYTLSIGPDIKDRRGTPLGRTTEVRFHTRPFGLVFRTPDAGVGYLAGFDARPEPWALPNVGPFAVERSGRLAYVRPEDGVLVVRPPTREASARLIQLPADLVVEDLHWVPGGDDTLVLLARPSAQGSQGVPRVASPHLVHFRQVPVEVTPLLEGESAAGAPSGGPGSGRSGGVSPRRARTMVLAPDGRSLITTAPNGGLVRVALDRSGPEVVGPYAAVGNFSPDGRSLLVVSVTPGDAAAKGQVLILGPENAIRPISDPESDSRDPRFASRGTHVALSVAPPTQPLAERRFALEVVDVGTGARRRLTSPPPGMTDANPEWSPDDSWILFRRFPAGDPARGRVFVVPSEGGEVRQLPVEAVAAHWSP